MGYAGLGLTEKATANILTCDRLIAFGLLKTSSNSHDKIKLDLLDDFTKGSDNYHNTPQQTLLLTDKYSKKPTSITQSEGTVLAQKEKNGMAKKSDDADPKKFDKELCKDNGCFHCGKKGHPKAACTVKIMIPADNDKSSVLSSSKGSGGLLNMGKIFSLMCKSLKTFGKAMS